MGKRSLEYAGGMEMIEENILREFKTAEEKVKHLLSTDERCRNCDMWLLFRYWYSIEGINIYFPFDKLKTATKYETVSRVRRKIQARGEFPPTCPQVVRRRRIKQEVISDWSVKDK